MCFIESTLELINKRKAFIFIGLSLILVYLIGNYIQINNILIISHFREYGGIIDVDFDVLCYQYEAYLVKSDFPFIYYQCGLDKNDDKSMLRCKNKKKFTVINNFENLRGVKGEFILRVIPYLMERIGRIPYLSCRQQEGYCGLFTRSSKDK